MPDSGFHSVIDSPDSVNRVIPPTTTIATISAATHQSQRATAPGRAREGRGGASIAGV
ncbi:hypothetical protein [Sphingomonas hankookensis]|uniref:hypothetical protein n=1 Tax=Sphingomonas hankookensis TaxID=563996 RepID=UPI003D303259